MEEQERTFGTLGFLSNCIDDRRLPAPDVMGVLADYQVRKPQLDEIAREVDKNWLGVCKVSVGVLNNCPHFYIDIVPFSKELQRQHWGLGDVIRTIIGNDSFPCLYLPRREDTPYSSDVVVYQRE